MAMRVAFGRRTRAGTMEAVRSSAVRLAEQARERIPEPGWPYAWLGLGLLAGAALAALARAADGGSRRRRRVGEVMITDVVTIDPSATVIEASRRMQEANVGMLPVVEQGILRGVITDRDIVVRVLARGADPAMVKVGECASTAPLAAARPDWDDEEALRVMETCQIGRLPVTDEQRRLLGVVTLSSLALRLPDGTRAFEAARQVSRRSARIA